MSLKEVVGWSSDHPCINYEGWKNSKGYGRRKYKGKMWQAHRAAYDEFIGPIPDGMHVLHKCDNPSCINPEHLFLGTNLDNIKDRVNKNRSAPKHGEHNGRSILTEDDVIQIKRKLLKYKKGMCLELSKEYKVKPSVISHIKNGHTWKHVAL